MMNGRDVQSMPLTEPQFSYCNPSAKPAKV